MTPSQLTDYDPVSYRKPMWDDSKIRNKREMYPDELAHMMMEGGPVEPRREYAQCYARDVERGCYRQTLKPNAHLKEIIESGQTRVSVAERDALIRDMRANPFASKRRTTTAQFDDPGRPQDRTVPYPWAQDRSQMDSSASVRDQMERSDVLGNPTLQTYKSILQGSDGFLQSINRPHTIQARITPHPVPRTSSSIDRLLAQQQELAQSLLKQVEQEAPAPAATHSLKVSTEAKPAPTMDARLRNSAMRHDPFSQTPGPSIRTPSHDEVVQRFNKLLERSEQPITQRMPTMLDGMPVRDPPNTYVPPVQERHSTPNINDFVPMAPISGKSSSMESARIPELASSSEWVLNHGLPAEVYSTSQSSSTALNRPARGPEDRPEIRVDADNTALQPKRRSSIDSLTAQLIGPGNQERHLPTDFQWTDIPPTPLHMAPGSVEQLPPQLTAPEEAFLTTMRHYEEIGQLMSSEGSRLGLSNTREIGQALEKDGRRLGHQMLRAGGADASRLAVYGREAERPQLYE